MKKFLKVFGIAMAGLFGLVAVAVAIAAISGLFSDEEIKVESLSWEVTKVRVVDDFTATVNFLPENANVLDVELKLLTSGAENIVEVPATVKAGEPFTIKVKKDANGNNIGGEVKIQAKTSLVVTDPNMDILVDVPIPNNGLLIASDHDCAEGDKILSAGTSEFGMYVYTNPNVALNPNTGLVPDLAESYKNIQIKSTDTNKLQILNTVGEKKEGFYCPNYIAHNHKGPFKDSNGNALTQYCNGVKLQKYKYIEYRAKALTSTAVDVPVIVTAKALRTYSMQEQYVSKDDPKYLTAGGSFEGEGREQYYNDLSNYVNEFKDYIIADTRPNVDSQNPSIVNFENGAAFIESVTKTNDAGETYIKINESRIQEEAAYFYFFVECRTIFNIEDIEVENVKTNIQSKVEYNLHGALEQYDVNDLKTHFGLSLIASNEEFDENDLAYRYRDLRVISIMDKAQDSESNYSFDFSNYFEIQNPTSTTDPIWTIRAINPISTADRSRNPRLRFYIPSSPTKEFTAGDPYADVGIEIQEIQVEELKLLTDGNNMIDATMIINTQDYNGYSYRQILDNTRYTLTGVGKKTPTYTTVRYFVTEESAKTKFEGTDTSFFKVKLNNDDKTPVLKTMPYGSSSVKGYEIAYQFNGQTCLEAINITNGDDLKIFAAVVKTDYNGKPVDSNGVSEGQEGYNGIYQIVAKSTNTISITINNYLEKLNIYTINSDNIYALRNVQATGTATQDTVQLLAGQDYTLKVSPFYLTKSGEIDMTHSEYVNGTIIDYKTNLMVATKNASTAAEIMFSTDSTDFTYDVTPTLNSDVIVYDVNINALVDSTANPNEKRDADFNAYGVGSISKSFDRTKSTINMFVNYASIDDFMLQTNVEEVKSKYVLYPQVYEMDQDGQPKVTWIEESALINKDTTPFSLQTFYTYDIEDLVDNPDGSKSYGPKVDKNIGTSLYVNNYIREFLNFSNSNAVNVSWDLKLISGGKPGESVDSYARIIEEEAPEGSDLRSVTRLSIEKGTKEGVEILATCTLGLYRTTGDNFVERKQVSVLFELVQSDVGFTLYSPRTEKVGEENNKFILVENGTDALSYEVEGGKGDFTNQVDASRGYNLLRDYGDQVHDIYEYKNGEYVQVPGKTASKYVKVTMGDDGKLALYCTYEIESLGGKTPAIYFLNDEGNKVYKSTPDANGDLYFYAEYVSEDTTEKIIIKPPFKDTETKPYYVKVLSSISLTMPTNDITISTTEAEYVDLATIYSAKRDYETLKIGFEITDKNGGNAFAGLQKADGANPIPVLNDDGTITEDYQYLTKFIPYEVNSDKVVYMNMYYFVPEEIVIGEDPNDGTPLTRTVYVKNVIANNENINVIVKPGYSVDKKLDSITNKETTPFKIKSGNTFDLFDTASHIAVTGKNITSGFIKITNLYNASIGTLEEAQITTYLPKLITLAYDVDALDPADRTIFESLFEDTNTKNQIENGKLITKSIASDIIIPIKVLFKEGSNSYSSSYVATIDPIFTFYVKVEASVDFYISDSVKPEGTDYSTDEISYKDGSGATVTITGSQIGHTYNNINVDKNDDGVIDLGEYKTTLFDSSKAYTENILSLRGTDGNELFDVMYKSYYLYKLVDDEFVYVTSDDKVTIEVTKSEDQTKLKTLVLNITNAVNATTYYKLALSTTINKESETFDYYFAINPTYKLKVNYPLVTEKEKVVVGSRINLLENYINENDRIQVYANYVLVAGGAAKEFVYTITPTTGNTYSFTTTNSTFNKTFELSSTTAPFKFEVLSGSAHIESGIVVFDNFTSSATIQDVKVRVTLFNGVYVDYEFELYKNLSTTTFTTEKNITAYAATEINIYDYLELTSTPPDNFRYIIKYVGSLEATFENPDGSETVLDPTEFATDSNKIINYSGAEIKVTFEDTDVVTNVMFKVWTNYSISGENYVALNIKLYPNLQVVKNTNTAGNDKVTSIVANTSTVVMSPNDDTWLKVSNEDTSIITVSVIKVDGNDYNMYGNATEDYLGIDITANQTNRTYTFISKNVGIVRDITFKIEKATGTLTYSMEFTIKLVPNINLNSAYLGSSVCDVTAASAYDANQVKHITLNNVVVDDGYIINPTDYFGNALDVQEGTTSTESNVASSFTVDCYIYDNEGNKISASATCGVTGCTANNAVINLSLIPINFESRIYIDIQITWANGVEPYKATLNLNIIPNILTASEGVTYSSAQSLTVLAGSKIYVKFDNDKAIKFEQNGASASIRALQSKADGGTSNAHVVFKVENKKDDLFILGEDAEGYYIQFKGVSKTETISVFYYLDLSGSIRGLFTENASLESGNISYLNFNDERSIHYDDQNKNPNNYSSDADKLSNYSRKVSFKIVPSITSMVYADSNNKHEDAEHAIDITEQFKSIYANVTIDSKEVNSITIDDSTFNLTYVKDHADILAGNNQIEVHGFRIADLFSYTPVAYGTFTDEANKVALNKSLLYSAFNYDVVVKLGNFDTAWGSTSEMITLEGSDSENYFFVDKPEGVIYFIPPKGASTTNTVWMEVTVSSIGQGDQKLSQVVYFKFQYTGTQKDESDANAKTEYLGNGSEIISIKTITETPFTTVGSLDYLTYLGTTNAVSGGIDLNRGVTYNLKDYFKIGYLLRTINSDAIPSSYNATKNIQIIQQNAKAYYFYLLNNVELSYELKGDSTAYAKIENGVLIPENYYINVDDVNISEFRTITLAVSAGSVVTEFEIYIYPIKVKQNFTCVDNVFNNELITSAGLTDVDIVSNKVELVQGSLTNAEYEEYKQWLKFNGTNYVFEPVASKLYNKTLFTFKNEITLGSGIEPTVLTKTESVEIEPVVGLHYNYESTGVEANVKAEDTAKVFAIIDNSETSSLFKSNVFAHSGSATTIIESITFAETSDTADYDRYVEITGVTPGADDGVYIIENNAAAMTIKNNQLLSNVELPYKLTIVFKNNNYPYTLEKEFNLVINRNSGVFGFKEAYTNLDNVVVIKDGNVYDSAKILLPSSKLGGNAKVIGDGTIDYGISSENFGAYGYGTLSPAEILSLINIHTDSVDGTINSITIDYVELLRSGKITGLYKIELLVYYVETGGARTLICKVVLESTIKTINVTSNYKSTQINKGREYVVVANTGDSIFKTDIYEVASAQVITLTQNDDYTTSVTLKDGSSNDIAISGNNYAIGSSNIKMIVNSGSSEETLSYTLKIEFVVGELQQTVTYDVTLSVASA